ncbi:MAG: DUF929 family protein [Nitrososphaerales archaeon]
MPKCSKCGKKFGSLNALEDHFRSAHKSERFVAPKSSPANKLVASLIIVVVVVGAIVGYLIYLQGQQPAGGGGGTGLLGMQISPELYLNLSSVSFSTLSSVGGGQGVASPTSISDPPLTSGGNPEVLYIGAEFCPYCAAERWSLAIALLKFGSFTGLEYMLSAQNDGNISTFSFRNSSYTSQYISFVSVENEDRNHAALQAVSPSEQQLWNKYSSSNAYPFVYIAGSYVVTGAQFGYSDLSGLSWTQIGSQLNNPSSSVAKVIDGAANTLITAICKADGGNATSLCSQTFAALPLAYVLTSLPGSLASVAEIEASRNPDLTLTNYARR